MKLIALSTLIALGAPMTAMAGGMAAPVTEPAVVAPAPMMAPVASTDWSGFYTGVQLGFGHSYTAGIQQDGKIHAAGVDVGYRTDMGGLVVGGELSYNKDDINVGATDNTVNNTTALKLIVGKSMGRTLVYGTAGVARADAQIAGVGATDTGYTLGLGADYALNDKWTVGGELSANRYFDFNNSGVTLKDTTVAVKVGYRF